MAMQMRVRERKGGDVAIARGRIDRFVRVRRQRTKARGEHVARRVGEREAVRGVQLMGKHDDAMRVGGASEL